MSDQPRQDVPTKDAVLVADDEPGMRELLGVVLQGEGHDVIFAENGDEALQQFQENRDRIGLVIQDLKMPGLEGTELLQRLRDLSPATPVVVITAFSTWALNSSADMKPTTR